VDRNPHSTRKLQNMPHVLLSTSSCKHLSEKVTVKVLGLLVSSTAKQLEKNMEEATHSNQGHVRSDLDD
jgi:hypothetical protein